MCGKCHKSPRADMCLSTLLHTLYVFNCASSCKCIFHWTVLHLYFEAQMQHLYNMPMNVLDKLRRFIPWF